MLRRVVMVLLIVIAAMILALAWLRWSEPRLIYYPTRAIERTPDQLGWAYEDLGLVASDGVRIRGWYVPAARAAAAPEAPAQGTAPPGTRPGAEAAPRSRVVVLLLHGNAGNISHRFDKVAGFRDQGADVLLVDYRGYGMSEGHPDEAGTYRDARAAYDYLIERRIDPRRIVLYGESLGAAVAVELASQVPVGGLVIEEAFTSIADVAQEMYRFLPVRGLVRNRYDAISRLPRVRSPLLIFHSRGDEYFGMHHARALLAAARSPARLVVLSGGHNDAFVVSGEIWRRSLGEFFAEVEGSAAGPASSGPSR